MTKSHLSIDGKEFDVSKINGNILCNEPMSKHTTWKVGGPAKIYYQPENSVDLQAFLKVFNGSFPIIWLGLGSNVLVRDGGINGIVINALGCMNEIEFVGGKLENNYQQVRVQAGATCSKYSRTIAEHGLHGAEFLSGIPGTMGGAIAMNAGAFGGECWDYLESVETIDGIGEIRHRKVDDFDVGYRCVKRLFNTEKDTNTEWFLSGVFSYPKNVQKLQEAKQKIRQLLEKRNSTQPVQFANAGSVFKNPPAEYAARLIEACGLKDYVIGDACVSKKHANFIINRGKAKAEDIERLILMVQEVVEEKFAIKLEREIRIIGEKSLQL